MVRKSIYIISVIFLLVSCEKEIDKLDIQGINLLVVNSFINPDSMLTVYVSESLQSYESFFSVSGQPIGYRGVNDVEIQCFEEDNQVAILTDFGNGIYKADYYPNLNTNYKLNIKHQNFPNVSTSTQLPELITIDSVIFMGAAGDEDVYFDQHLRIYYHDKSHERNFYNLVILCDEMPYLTVYTFGQNSYFSSDDPVFNKIVDQKQYHVFSDELFDGESYGLDVAVSSKSYVHQSDSLFYYVYLCSLNEDYYKYLEDFNRNVLITDSDHNPLPLSEPIQIYNNIENGFGIFGGFQVDCDTVIIIK